MKEKITSVCLVLAVHTLFFFTCLLSGAFAQPLPGQIVRSTETADGSLAGNAAVALSADLMVSEIERQKTNPLFSQWFQVLSALLIQGALWSKSRFADLHLAKNKRFAVESITSHPQQAPPLCFQRVESPVW